MNGDANILELPGLPAAISSNVASDDAALIEHFRQGDRDAFTALYRIHHPAIFRFTLLMTADRAKATDITQDVFVWLIRHPGEFDPRRGSLGPFLAGVARKLLQHRERQERRWLPFLDAGAPQAAPDPADGMDRAIDGAALRKAIAMLPLRYREAIVLCDLEDKNYEEAAAALGCAVGTIRSRLHRGRELLARKFLPNKETRK